MSMYYSCPYCGNNLDHGERCDCKEVAEHTARPQVGEKMPERQTANPHRPVLARGA